MITSVLNYLGRNVIRIFTFFFLLLLASLGFSQTKILFADDYENQTSTYTSYMNWAWRDLPYPTSMVHTQDYVRNGLWANKITLNKTDPLVSNNHRAELVWNSNAAFNQTNTGVQWIGYSCLLPPSWIDDVNHPESIVNIHDGESCANAGTNPQALWLSTVGGVTHFIYVVNITTVPYCSGGSNQITRQATFDLGPATKGVWHDWVFHSNWSPNSDGYVQIWHNGTQVVDYHGPCWYQGIFSEPYIKFGDYKFSWTNETAWGGNSLVTTRVLYNDNIKIGSSAATLSDFLVGAVSPPANQAPTANAGSNQTITLPTSTANLTGTGTDADGTISKYAWTQVSGPNTATIASAATANTGVSNLVQGTYTFKLTVTDNAGATGTSQMTVTVNAAPVNQPPVANAGTNQSITLPTNSANLAGTGTDADGTISKYAWTQASGPSTATIASPSTANTAVNNLVQGTYSFTLTVTDNGGKTATSSVSVTVNAAPVDQPPVANAGSNQSITLPTNSASLAGTGTDADGTISKYAWTQASGPSTATIASPSTANTTVNNLVQGTYSFTLTVTDNGGKTATSSVSVTVNAAVVVNKPPVANAGTNQSITLPTNTANVNGSASSDPNGNGTITKYAWSQISGPNTASFGNAAAATSSVNGLVQGVYAIQLTVTDNLGLSAADTVTITVNAAANKPPVASAGADFTITLPTSTGNLNGSASSDPDGTISKYAWTQVSGPSTATFGNAGAATSSINGLVQGSYVIQLTVTDNLGLSASDQLTITVNAAPVTTNKKPVAVPGQNKKIVLPTSSTNLNGTASYDPDGNITSFSWTQVSGPSSATVAAPTSASTNVTNMVQGTYTFKLSVTDNSGAVGTDTVLVQVDPAVAAANQPPYAYAGANLTVVLPVNTVTLNGSGSNDADGSIASYSWSQLKGPNAANIGFPNSTNTGVSGLIQGDYTFNLVVTDNLGLSSSDTVHVTVNPQPAPGPNQAPVANSGGSKSINLPTTSVLLNGASSYDPDGTIASWSWKQVSGPTTALIQTPANNSTGIYGMQVGVYEFELTVTDNKGLTATDRSVVTVGAAIVPAQPSNVPPVAVAADTTVITLPIQNTSLDGSKSYDSLGGTIAAYSWSYVSGPSVPVLANTDQSVALAKDMVVGTYVFSLTVTDNQGATDTKNVTVMVMNSATRPQISTVTYYPNPAHWRTTLQVEGSARGKATLQIYNSSGQLVSSQVMWIDQQTFTKDIYLRGLPKGTYYMNLRIGSNSPVVRKLQKL